MIALSWRDEKSPQEAAEDLLELACGGELTSRGRWIAWINRARKLPWRLKNWLIQKIRERISDETANYLAGYLTGRGRY